MGQIPSTQQDISADLEVKADRTEVTNGLALKADKTALTSGLALKADKTELNNYARTTALTSGLALKADKTELTSGLALKADKTELTSGLALKADKTELTSGLALKADRTELSGYATTASLGLKADKSELNQYVKTANLPSPQNLSDYAKKTDLDSYAKTSDMPGRTMWCADGNLCSMPANRTVNIPSSTILQLGADVARREGNAGKIAYKAFSQGLDIVGAGEASSGPRQITMWDAVNVQGVITATDFRKGDQSLLVGTDLVNYTLKTEADAKYSTKTEADAKYATKTESDAKYSTKTELQGYQKRNETINLPAAVELNLGSDRTKQEAAGRIAYQRWSQGLDIVGAGTTDTERQVSVWDNLNASGTIMAKDFKRGDLRLVDESQLANYSIKTEADGKYATKTQLDSYYTKQESDAKLATWATANTATEVSRKTMWCADGQVCELPSTAKNVKMGTTSMEFGSGLNKEANAGKIVYGDFGHPNKLSIVGGGPAGQPRTVRIWDSLEVDKLNNVGFTGPFNFRLYDKMGGQRCMDTNAWAGNGDEVCSDSRSQLFYYSPLTGQIQAVSNNQCLTQNGGQWNWQPCNSDDPNQQFWKKEHIVQWRNGDCLDLGNTNHKSACDGNNANQKMVWRHRPQ